MAPSTMVVFVAVVAASSVAGLAVSIGDCVVGWGGGEGGDATVD
jgi:hypothetical protein